MEELNLRVGVGSLLGAWVFEVLPGSRVPVLAYGCFVEDLGGMARSVEHSDVGVFGPDELEDIALPEGYERVVRVWAGHSAVSGSSGP